MLARRSAFERAGLFSDEWAVGEFVDWYARAIDAGLRSAVPDEVVLRRRVHTGNSGNARRHEADYVRVLREVRRRRQAAAGP